MNLARSLTLLVVMSVALFACGGGGGSESAAGACEDLCEWISDCNEELGGEPIPCFFSCELFEVLEESDYPCEDEFIDLVDCITSQTCDELEGGELEDECDSEGEAFEGCDDA